MTCLIEEMSHEYFVQQYYGCAAVIDDVVYKFIGFTREGLDPKRANQHLPTRLNEKTYKDYVVRLYRHEDYEPCGPIFWKALMDMENEAGLQLLLAQINEKDTQIQKDMQATYTRWDGERDPNKKAQIAKEYAQLTDLRGGEVLKRTMVEKVLENAVQLLLDKDKPKPKEGDNTVYLVFHNMEDTSKFLLKEYNEYKELHWFDVPRGYVMVKDHMYDTLTKQRAIQYQRFQMRVKEITEAGFLKRVCSPTYMPLEVALAHMRTVGLRRIAISPNMLLEGGGNDYYIQHRVLGVVGSISKKEIKLPRKLAATVNMVLLEEAING